MSLLFLCFGLRGLYWDMVKGEVRLCRGTDGVHFGWRGESGLITSGDSC